MVRAALLLLLFALAAPPTRAQEPEPPLALRLVLPDLQPVVGEMIPVVVRGEYEAAVALESMSFPDSPGYDWMQYRRDEWHKERVGGREKLVFERHVAVFPRAPGVLQIGPVVHRLTIGGPAERHEVSVRAHPVAITVSPSPVSEHFPSAARALTIKDELSTPPGSLRDGETLLRRVTVRAEGTLPHLLPPRPVVSEPWLISFASPEARTVEPGPDGPVTVLKWEWSLRPHTGEPGVVPPFELRWFDTGARTTRVAELEAIPLGYASFHSNIAAGGHMSRAGRLVAGGTLAAGVLAGLGVLSWDRRAAGWRALRRRAARWLPDPAVGRMRRAARAGDVPALRAAAEDYLSRREALGIPRPEGATTRLDRALYGPGDGAIDPGREVSALLARRKA